MLDGNNGGITKAGVVEKAIGTIAGTDVQGDLIAFPDFTATAGFSTQTNLANASLNEAEINQSSTAYQDITPEHGGLGAYSAQADDAFKETIQTTFRDQYLSMPARPTAVPNS